MVVREIFSSYMCKLNKWIAYMYLKYAEERGGRRESGEGEESDLVSLKDIEDLWSFSDIRRWEIEYWGYNFEEHHFSVHCLNKVDYSHPKRGRQVQEINISSTFTLCQTFWDGITFGTLNNHVKLILISSLWKEQLKSITCNISNNFCSCKNKNK